MTYQNRAAAVLAAAALVTAVTADGDASAQVPSGSAAASSGSEDTPGFGPAPADEPRSHGREVAPPRARPEPAATPVVACSFEQPVCVHAAASVTPLATMSTLRYAERALRAYRALGLPGPLPDGSLGGGPEYDLYVVPGTEAPVTTADLLASGGGWDQASAFTILPPPSPRAGCEAGFAVAQGIAHATCLRFDAGAEDGAMAMASTYLASLAASCDRVELAAIDDFQRHPERSFMAGNPDRPDGSMLFPWFLDDGYGRGAPGGVITALLALASQRTPAGSWEWQNEPDIFDALRATMKSRGSTADNLLLDFAVARAFTGSRSDGGHLVDTERFGAMGRVRFEWAVPYDSLPRRLAPAAPIEATGMTYVWLDLAGAPPGAELTFVADWELPSLFRWSLVKVDKEGAEAGRVEVAGLFGSNHVERTVVGLDGLAGVMVVGVNAGSIDRSHPFDPDEQPLMPHSYTVTLVK
jgi:hypothetical protein